MSSFSRARRSATHIANLSLLSLALVAGLVSAQTSQPVCPAADEREQLLSPRPPALRAWMSGDGGEEEPQDDSLQSSPSSTQAGLYPRYAHAIAGAGGGLATVLALHPVDTLKTRLQSDAASRRIGALRVVRGIVLLEGPRALYRGSIPAMVGSVASWAFYMHWFHTMRGVISSRHAGAPPSAGTDFLAGTSAGLLTALGTNPIWVVKVRLQLQRGPAVHQGLAAAAGSAGTAYTGMLHGFRCILRDEGVAGLYKGLGPSLWLVSHGAIQFTLYEQFKTALVSLSSKSSSSPDEDGASSSGTSVRDSLLASTASKLVAAAATYPLQLVRTRMQERGAGGDRYGTFFAGFSRVLRIEGPRGFYRGFAANVARVLPQSAVTFVTYEQIMNLCASLNAKYGSSESQRS